MISIMKAHLRKFVKRNLQFLLKEYKVDGFV